MKKISLLIIMVACFAIGFAAPASATRWDGIEPRGNVEITPKRVNDGVANDMRYGANRVADDVRTGFNRAANDVERGVNRMGRGMERTFGVNDYDGARTLDTSRNVNGSNYRTNNFRAANTTANTGFSWGWLGLIGLIGLAGLRSSNRDRA